MNSALQSNLNQEIQKIKEQLLKAEETKLLLEKDKQSFLEQNTQLQQALQKKENDSKHQNEKIEKYEQKLKKMSEKLKIYKSEIEKADEDFRLAKEYLKKQEENKMKQENLIKEKDIKIAEFEKIINELKKIKTQEQNGFFHKTGLTGVGQKSNYQNEKTIEDNFFFNMNRKMISNFIFLKSAIFL